MSYVLYGSNFGFKTDHVERLWQKAMYDDCKAKTKCHPVGQRSISDDLASSTQYEEIPQITDLFDGAASCLYLRGF